MKPVYFALIISGLCLFVIFLAWGMFGKYPNLAFWTNSTFLLYVIFIASYALKKERNKIKNLKS